MSSQAYIPLFTAQHMAATGAGIHHKKSSPQEKITKDSKKERQKKPWGQVMIRDELLNRTHKFLGVVNSTIHQLQLEGLLYLTQQRRVEYEFIELNLLLIKVLKHEGEFIPIQKSSNGCFPNLFFPFCFKHICLVKRLVCFVICNWRET